MLITPSRYQKTLNECSSGDGTPLIDFKRLVSDIEAVFTVKDLERKPTKTVVGEVCVLNMCVGGLRCDF